VRPEYAFAYAPGATYNVGICSLGINYYLTYNDPFNTVGDAYGGPGNFRYPRMDILKEPSRIGLLMDTGRGFFGYTQSNDWNHHPGGNLSYDPRHLGRVNMILADGHLETRDFDWFYPYNDVARDALIWPYLLE